MYGTASQGGVNGGGIVFELVNSSGSYTEQVLYSFSNTGGDGYSPTAGLIRDSAGNLYGTTNYGGAQSFGTVFELVNNAGSYSEQVLYSFAGGLSDGSYPNSPLIRDSAGNLYGTTQNGPPNTFGTVFELVNNSGVYSEQILHAFTNTGGDGAYPTSAALVRDSSGNLYGTAGSGGAGSVGIVFELVNSSGSYTEQVLHTFTNLNGDGSYPQGGLIQDSAGILYGTTLEGPADYSGSPSGFGTVFELANPPSGSDYSTTTVLTSSLNPASAGDSITLNANVTTSSPNLTATGTVSFLDGATALGTSNPVGGNASITIDATAIGVGTYTITAQFVPSASYLTGSSGNLSQTVTENGVALTNGNNSFNGNQSITGSVSATSFSGNGSGLTNVTASGLSCTGCVGNPQLGINYAGSATQGGAATNALLLGGNPASTFATVGPNLFVGNQTITGGLTATGALSTPNLALPAGGTATTSGGVNSGAFDSAASLFSSTAGVAQNMLFRWQAEPVTASNNTASPLATLNLLYGANVTPTETGLSINHDGTINFVTGQTFPGAGGGGGGGSITGVTAGAGLSGGGTTGNVTLSIPSLAVTNAMLSNSSVTVNAGTGLTGGGAVALGGSVALFLASNACAQGSALTAIPFRCTPFAGTGANSFVGNQSVTGGVTATAFSGNGSGLINVNALSLGGNLPASFAKIAANTFTGAQTMPSLSVSGAAQEGSVTIGGGTAITEYVSVTRAITLPAIATNTCATFTTAPVTGFTPGASDTIALGVPSGLASGLGGGVFMIHQAWETSTAANPTITIQFCNPSTVRYTGGASGTVRIDIFKH